MSKLGPPGENPEYPNFARDPILGGPGDPDNPGFTGRPIPGGKDDLEYPPVLGGKDDPDNPHFGSLDDDVTLPADAGTLLNCTTVEQLEKRHHHSKSSTTEAWYRYRVMSVL